MKKGYDAFGKAYGVMLRNDPHHKDSVDHTLLKEIMLLDASSESLLYDRAIDVPKTIDKHALYDFAQSFRSEDAPSTIRNVLDHISTSAWAFSTKEKPLTFGGTEVSILKRGSDWCADLSRVGCVLLQCLGIPARMVYTVNDKLAYHGHVVVEAFYDGAYGVCDFLYGVLAYDHRPYSAKELRDNPDLVELFYSRDYPGYDKAMDLRNQYNVVAISHYDPMVAHQYIESGLNDYTRTLLQTPHHGKWFMGEDA